LKKDLLKILNAIIKESFTILRYIKLLLVPFCIKPTFIIIGAQKSGTTSLFHYLTQHPDILKPIVRGELHYFDLHFVRGPNWYKSHFPLERNGKISGEKSPYYIYHPLTPQRCHAFNPNFKLIALLRDPVKRAYSHFHHEIENGRENRIFRQAVEQEMERVEKEHLRLARSEIAYSYPHQRFSYYARGNYVEQLDLWTKFFPRHQLYLETAERFFKEPKAVCSEIYNFLGIESFKVNTEKRHNTGNYDPISKLDERWLAEIYRENNQKLSQNYGVDISDWI
jgi:hypothetical protein